MKVIDKKTPGSLHVPLATHGHIDLNPGKNVVIDAAWLEAQENPKVRALLDRKELVDVAGVKTVTAVPPAPDGSLDAFWHGLLQTDSLDALRGRIDELARTTEIEHGVAPPEAVARLFLVRGRLDMLEEAAWRARQAAHRAESEKTPEGGHPTGAPATGEHAGG